MGIEIGQNWKHAIYIAITGCDPLFRFRLRAGEQQRLLDVAQRSAMTVSGDEAVTLPECAGPATPATTGDREYSSEARARGWAIINVLLHAGLFIEELASLEPDCFMQEEGRLVLRFRGYTGEPTYRPVLSPVARSSVDAYLHRTELKTSKCSQLFITTPLEELPRRSLTPYQAWLVVKALMRRARIESARITPFALRNSYAKAFLDAGGEPDELAEIFGLKRPGTMNRYAHDLDDWFINGED